MVDRSAARFVTPVVLVLAATTANGQTFADGFEGYPSGSNLDGQGGWHGWDGVSLGLTTVTNSLAFEGTRSVAMAPAGHTLHELDVHSGQWIVTSHVFAPSASTGSHWLVFLDEYSDGGPYEWGGRIELDGTHGVVSCDCGGFGAFVVTLVTDQWVEVRLELDLDTDVAEIYYGGALLGTWTWSSGYDGGDNTAPVGFEGIDLSGEPAATGSVYFDAIEVRPGGIGTNYCIAQPNSTGHGAVIAATGNQVAAAGNLTLHAGPLPNQPGLFFFSASQQQVPFGNGFLCAGGGGSQIFRLPVEFAAGYVLTHQVDFAVPPASAIVGGSTWFFQAWYREPVSITPFNLSDGLEIQFR